MSFNDFHMKIATAFPDIKEVDSPKGRTFRAEISTDKGNSFAFIKLLHNENIAREVLCAVLARKLHLPMLQPYYVGIDPSYLQGYKIGNIEHVAFGLEEDSLPSFRIRGQQIENEVLKWPELKRCAVFDEWIANDDRLPDNLRFSGHKYFWLIDHDEAIPSNLSFDEPINTKLLDLLRRGKSEIELNGIRRDLMHYVETYKKLNWDEILELTQPQYLPGIENYINKYITFLSHRADVMYEILTQRLQIRQKELQFSNSKTNMKTLKK